MIRLRTETEQGEVKLSDAEAQRAAEDFLVDFPTALKESLMLPGILTIATSSPEDGEITSFQIYRYPSELQGVRVVRYDGSYFKRPDGSGELQLSRVLNPAIDSLVQKLQVTKSPAYAAVAYWLPPNGDQHFSTHSAVENGKTMLANFRKGR